MSLLAPLRRSLKKFGIYLLPLPSAAIQPGTILDRKGQPVQHLLDFHNGKMAFFSTFPGTVRLGEPYPASAVLSSHDHTVSVGGGIGAGLPRMASLELGVQHSSSVTMKIGKLYEKKLIVGERTPLDVMDYLVLSNDNQHSPLFRPIADLMKKRKSGWPAERWVDLVEATVYAEDISFEFHTKTAVELEVALTTAVQVDVEAGLGVEYEGGTVVKWTEGLTIPIGFKPVRYAWKEKTRSFVLAWS